MAEENTDQLTLTICRCISSQKGLIVSKKGKEIFSFNEHQTIASYYQFIDLYNIIASKIIMKSSVIDERIHTANAELIADSAKKYIERSEKSDNIKYPPCLEIQNENGEILDIEKLGRYTRSFYAKIHKANLDFCKNLLGKYNNKYFVFTHSKYFDIKLTGTTICGFSYMLNCMYHDKHDMKITEEIARTLSYLTNNKQIKNIGNLLSSLKDKCKCSKQCKEFIMHLLIEDLISIDDIKEIINEYKNRLNKKNK